jgi:hypothetical protein
VGLFRRRQETLNEQLLREAGLDPAQALGDPPPPMPLEPPKSLYSKLGLPEGSGGGPRQWDAVATARAPGLAGEQVEFVTLPNGDILVEQGKGDGDLSPLADVVEKKVDPPYRATATRQEADLWGVGATEIWVAEFRLAEGDAVEVTENDGVQEVRVDGEPSGAEIPELVQFGKEAGADYCVEAKRIDGDFWEVEVSAL